MQWLYILGASMYAFYGNYVYLCVYIIMSYYLCVYIIMHDYLCLKHAKWLIIIFVCMMLL